MKRKKEKRVFKIMKIYDYIAWDMLQKKMQKLNLSEAE